MEIESDEEFLAAMRARFASKPYTSKPGDAHRPTEEYWTDARYDELIADLLKTQQAIREASQQAPNGTDSLSPEDYDAACVQWAIWSIVTHDVVASPTHWHRVWHAVGSVIMWTRMDERRRIAEALRRDNAAMLGPTATALVEEAIVTQNDSELMW